MLESQHLKRQPGRDGNQSVGYQHDEEVTLDLVIHFFKYPHCFFLLGKRRTDKPYKLTPEMTARG
jgi:hypothetical protein